MPGDAGRPRGGCRALCRAAPAAAGPPGVDRVVVARRSGPSFLVRVDEGGRLRRAEQCPGPAAESIHSFTHSFITGGSSPAGAPPSSSSSSSSVFSPGPSDRRKRNGNGSLMREPRRPRARPGPAGRPAPRGWGGTASRRRGTAGGAEAVGAARGGGGGRPGWEEVTEAAEGAVLFREPSAFNELVVVREYAWGGATVRSLEFGLEDDLFQSAVAVPFRPTEVRPRRRGDEGGVGELQHAPAARRRRTPRGPPAPPPTGPRCAGGTAR